MVEDKDIIDLYFARSEDAIRETGRKYGQYCFRIASNILSSREDAEESVNDTYLSTWKSIPPTRPRLFQAFLGKITRHHALDRWRRDNTEKRGGGEVPVALEELEECVAGGAAAETSVRKQEFQSAINRFLEGLGETERKIFVSRYWYVRSVKSISEKTGLSESNVKTMLFRTREKLRKFLAEEDLL